MVNRTRKYMEDLKDMDIDNPGKEGPAMLSQDKERRAKIYGQIRSFMADFDYYISHYPAYNQPPSVDFLLMLLQEADVFIQETLMPSNEELRFLTGYSILFVNNTLRWALCNIATWSGAPDSNHIQYRAEMFRRRNELPITNSFRRTFVESYIDAEVYTRFYQNPASGALPPDIKNWDLLFNYIANENGELTYTRHSGNAPANNAVEVMQNKIAANFCKI